MLRTNASNPHTILGVKIMKKERIHNTKILKQANVISSRLIIKVKNTMVSHSSDIVERYTIPINRLKKNI